MDQVKIVEVKDNVLSENETEASKVRALLKEKKVFQINLMSSPGSGKTTLLCSLIPYLTKNGYRVLVLEADIDGDVDAYTILEKTNAKSIQIHTSGACHLTAQMTYDALKAQILMLSILSSWRISEILSVRPSLTPDQT